MVPVCLKKFIVEDTDNLEHPHLTETKANSGVHLHLGGEQDRWLVFPDFQSRP